MSTRYDRRFTSGSWQRLHQEDFCQALSVSPDKKYQHRDGGPGVADAARLVASLPLATDRRAVGAAFFRALVFNVVAGCTDAHAKNYSLLLNGRTIQLAPLYDLITYAGYWDGTSRIDSAMSVGNEYSFQKISAKSLVTSGLRFGLDRDEAEHTVESVRAEMFSAFELAREETQGLQADAVDITGRVLSGLLRLPLVQK